ncbi:MAG: molybdopterin-dependent oxidoreductase, partial [Bacteroidota bacterium]
MSQAKVQTHYRTCNLCEAMCGLEIQYQEMEVLSIKGDTADPFSRGHICPKALALKDIHADPDRLKFPLKKTEQGWQQITWEEAFDEVANRLFEIQEKYQDNNAVAIYQGNPNAHNLGTMLVGPNFTRSLKTKNRFSATSVDQLPHHFASYYILGHQQLLPIPDIDRTDYLLMLGANPLASNGSLMTAPDIGKRLRAIQERGGKVVVIDPRLTETAEKASAHHFINPGQDVYFLLAFIHVIFEEKLEKLGRLEAFTQGIEELKEASKDFAPEKVADVIGISAEEIRKLVREFCAAPRAVCYGRMGVSTQIFGSACNWLIYGINILSGNFDEPGGAMFTLPAVDVVGLSGMRGATGSHGRWKSRVRGLPEFGGEIPASTLAEEILTPGEGQIKALVTVAGNPVLSTPNGQQLEKALEELEFMVSIDIYITETSKHADIILPPQTGLEVPHYDIVFHYLAIRNTSKFSPRLFEPVEGSKADWEIFRALSERIMAKRGKHEHNGKKPSDPTKRFNPEAILNLALKFGPYGSKGSK